MRIYQKLVPRRLWQQIFFIILGLVIIPLVILGALLIGTSQKAIEESVSRDLKQIVLHATGEVLKEYEGVYHALEATASILGILHAEVWRQETAIVELALKAPALRHICSVDLKGNPLACSDLGEPLPKQASVDWDCAADPNRCISKVRIAADHVPVMDITVPIRRYGKIEGALTAEYNLRGIWDVMDKIQFGPQSKVILVDQNGRILAHPDKKEVLKNDFFDYPLVVKALQQGKNETIIIPDADRQKLVIAYSPISSLHWGLIVTQPYEEAFLFVKLMHYHSWILIAFSVLFSGLIGFVIAQWMSRPMNEMIAATRRLAQGDLSVSLPIQRRDEIGRLKFAFNHMIIKLRKVREIEQLSIVGRSAASIAHELKNSLVLVKTFVQLIPENHKDKEFVQKASQSVNKELDNWNDMLRNIMDFAREQMPLRRVVVNINTLVEEAALLSKFKAENQRLNFKVKTPEIAVSVEVDAARIKQVIINLITNALEATPVGGEIVVRTFCLDAGQKTFVGFEVSNSGEGIAQKDLNRIFDPFFTTKDTGLGLGLSICRDIVHRHGGRLEVTSEVGQGASFRVMLPAL